MVRRKQKSFNVLILAGALAFIFFLYVVLSTGNIRLSAEVYDEDGNLIGKDKLEQPIGAVATQSLFNPDIENIPLFLQSTIPADQEASVAILKAVVSNTQNSRVRLKSVSITKNNRPLYDRAWTQIFLDPGEEYIYETEPIELSGKDAQLNSIIMIFSIENIKGETMLQQYQYNYFSLTSCNSNDDCQVPHNLCDLNNAAGFSRTSERFCVKPCTDNSHCYPGQVCKVGHCGY